MSKINRATGPIRSEQVPSGKTHEGAPGYARDTKSELFLLGVNLFASEDTFYESAAQRNERFTRLVEQATVEDQGWTAHFLHWLRTEGNVRTASIMGAAHYAKISLDNQLVSPRAVVQNVLQRADEPGEFLAYWHQTFGRTLPKPVKRGLADAVRRLYTEHGVYKWDSDKSAFRAGDVVELVHPRPQDPYQSSLFKYLMDDRHGHLEETANYSLPRLTARYVLRNADRVEDWLDPTKLQLAGFTWENVLSQLGNRMSKKDLWEALIPNMGYMALLRNLRNFDQAGISQQAFEQVAARLSDPEQVARSRQFPFRFFSAYRQVDARWAPYLNQALAASTRNIPGLPGRTLILIDTSASMRSAMSDRSTVMLCEVAALFGITLGLRTHATDMYGYADGQFQFIPDSGDVLHDVAMFTQQIGRVGHGTQTALAIQRTFRPGAHDRVIVISDMQTMGGVSSWERELGIGPGSHSVTNAVPPNIPLFSFNLGGYQYGHAPAGIDNRYELGGLTDATFKQIPLLERGRDTDWPF